LDVLLLQVCLEVGGLAEIQGGSTDDSLQELLFLYEGGIAVTVGGSVVSSSCVRSSVVDGRWAVIDIPAVIHFQVLLQVVLVIHVKVTVPRERERTHAVVVSAAGVSIQRLLVVEAELFSVLLLRLAVLKKWVFVDSNCIEGVYKRIIIGDREM